MKGLQISILPPEICNLLALQDLYLAQNNLLTLPSEIGNLLQLDTFSIVDNSLSELPISLGRIPGITDLFIDGTDIQPEQTDAFLKLVKR